MTSEDPIPLDQDPMRSWIGVAHSVGYVLLVILVQLMHILYEETVGYVVVIVLFYFTSLWAQDISIALFVFLSLSSVSLFLCVPLSLLFV